MILTNVYTVSACEMFAHSPPKTILAKIIGSETAGRLIPGSGFKVGHGYMVVMPEAAFITWSGQRFEGSGIEPDVAVPWSPEPYVTGRDNQLECAIKAASGL